jgi:eukaryotic-like serine/threonine-protein kinase
VDDPRPGDRVGAYVLDAELGRGSMGIVFRARPGDGGDDLALKLLPSALAGDDTFRRRFERESRIARELRHPNIVEVVDAGLVDGRAYLATRIVDGPTLAERLSVDGALGERETVQVVAGLAAALDVLHERGLVHRDVKPENVLLDGARPVLTDFGLARTAADTVLTQPGRVSGTAEYLAPELILGAPPTPASDVYALGCLAYECVAGRPPFGGRSIAEVVVAHLEEEPAPPESPLGHAIVQALAKDPAARPPTAAAYALMLAVSAGA